jgi:hypothetical protein
VSLAPETARRRFAVLWGASALWKVAALAFFLYLAVRLGSGGSL